jgi:hypothetical protein
VCFGNKEDEKRKLVKKLTNSMSETSSFTTSIFENDPKSGAIRNELLSQ